MFHVLRGGAAKVPRLLSQRNGMQTGAIRVLRYRSWPEELWQNPDVVYYTQAEGIMFCVTARSGKLDWGPLMRKWSPSDRSATCSALPPAALQLYQIQSVP